MLVLSLAGSCQDAAAALAVLNALHAPSVSRKRAGVSIIGTNASLCRLLLGYGLTLFIFPFVVHWVFQGRGRMAAVSGPQAARWAVFALIVTCAVHAPPDVTRVAFAEMIAVSVAAAVSLVTLLRIGGHLDLVPVRPLDRSLIREGAPVCLSQAVWTLRMQLPAMIVAAMLGQAAVGFFGAANRLLTVSQAVLAMYFYGVFPRMSRVAGHELSRFLRRSVQLAFWPSLAIAIVLCATAPSAIQLIFGPGYAHGSPAVLRALIWVLPVVAWRANARQALIVVGRMREEAACSLAGLILLAVLVTALSRIHGLTGAAWAMLASEIAAAWLTSWRLRHHLRGIAVGS